jgi:hypothetical protein
MTASALEQHLLAQPALQMELQKANDAELAGAIRGIVSLLNVTVDWAAKRELIVTYRIKDGLKTEGLTNPRIIVSVTTEVI